jgi:hypothetical protein
MSFPTRMMKIAQTAFAKVCEQTDMRVQVTSN